MSVIRQQRGNERDKALPGMCGAEIRSTRAGGDAPPPMDEGAQGTLRAKHSRGGYIGRNDPFERSIVNLGYTANASPLRVGWRGLRLGGVEGKVHLFDGGFEVMEQAQALGGGVS